MLKKLGYSDEPLHKLKEFSPIFYKLYSISVYLVYFGVIVFSWYFINSAYTINSLSYDVLCSECNLFYRIETKILIIIWLLNFYFYILNEVRFRFWNYIEEITEYLIAKNNKLIYAITFLLTALSSTILINI